MKEDILINKAVDKFNQFASGITETCNINIEHILFLTEDGIWLEGLWLGSSMPNFELSSTNNLIRLFNDLFLCLLFLISFTLDLGNNLGEFNMFLSEDEGSQHGRLASTGVTNCEDNVLIVDYL